MTRQKHSFNFVNIFIYYILETYDDNQRRLGHPTFNPYSVRHFTGVGEISKYYKFPLECPMNGAVIICYKSTKHVDLIGSSRFQNFQQNSKGTSIN